MSVIDYEGALARFEDDLSPSEILYEGAYAALEKGLTPTQILGEFHNALHLAEKDFKENE